MDQEVEEVSFLPGEVILNKKAVYEPTKGQRFRQVVCSRGWATFILLLMGAVMIAIAVIAAFARPTSETSPTVCPIPGQESSSVSVPDTDNPVHEDTQTYIAETGEPFPWRELRLPKQIVPESYSIFLHANITESYFIGNIHMTLRAVQDTDFIVFHTKALNISNVKVFVPQQGNISNPFNFNIEVDVLTELEYPRNEQYYLLLADVLHNSTFIQVQVDFRGSLASLTEMMGFYKSSYNINGQERYIASTQFEPNSARLAFPCFDEPELKAKFTMSMVRDPQHITLFNMPLKRTAPYHGDLVVDEYEETVKMSTYLVAFVVCDFKNISATTEDGILIRLFAPEDKISMGKMALDAAVVLLDYYSSFFGTPYPLPKQDLVAIPNFGAGAMENWGLITFRESTLLYDPDMSTASSKEMIVATMAHELAHQWFGNLVTMKWWSDLWLNEGFATYVENSIGTDIVDKSFRKKDTALRDYLHAMSLDSLASSHPIAVDVNDPHEIESVFDDISYSKGSAIINMLHSFLTEAPFRKGLNNYLNKYMYDNAETNNLWECFQEVSNLPSHLTVSKIMDTWTKQMGLPVVTVVRHGGTIHLSQKRFLLSERNDVTGAQSRNSESPFGYKWIIPFTFMTSHENTQTLVWLSDEHDQTELNDGSAKWLKGNVGTQGFYRVNYDENGWQSIIQQLSEDYTVFSVEDRMGLIEDVFLLARAGLTDYRIALNLTRYMVNETDYNVWALALSHLVFLRGRMYLEEEYDQLKNYIFSLIYADIVDIDWSKCENPVDEYMQSLMISTAASLDYQTVIDTSLHLFQEWKGNTSVKISNGLRYTVYSQGVKHGTKSDWDFVFERYTKEIVPSEKHILLKTLSATSDARLLQMLLKYVLDITKVKSQDSVSVFTSVAGSSIGKLFAWQFLKEHYNTIYERYEDSMSMMSHIITSTVTGFNTQFEYDEVVAFFKNKKLGTGKRALDQALEYLKSHISWTKNYMPTVKTWIQDAYPVNRGQYVTI